MSNQLSGGRAIGLVARREFMTQISKKSFVISNVIILVAIIGGIIAFSLFSGGDEDKSKIGLVGNQSLSATMVSIGDTLGNPVTVTEVSDDGTARDQVKDGDLDVAVIAGSGGGVTVVTKKEVATNLRAVIESSVAQQAQSNALSAAGIDPAQLAEATSTAVVTIDAIDPPDPEQGQRIAMSIAAVVLLYMQILLFGTYVAMGVVEEKSSRVVELLLSTLRPLQLLWGKVLGIGAVGLMQMAAYAVAGVATGLATGVLTVTGTAIGVLFGTLGWFILASSSSPCCTPPPVHGLATGGRQRHRNASRAARHGNGQRGFRFGEQSRRNPEQRVELDSAVLGNPHAPAHFRRCCFSVPDRGNDSADAGRDCCAVDDRGKDLPALHPSHRQGRFVERGVRTLIYPAHN